MEKRFVIILFFLVIGILFLGYVENAKKVYTVAEILGSLKEGQKAEVYGTAKPYKLKCTQMACPADNPCCNSCGGQLSLADGKSSIRISGLLESKAPACRGDECMQECWPLENGKEYVVSGIFEIVDGEPAIMIESFRRKVV